MRSGKDKEQIVSVDITYKSGKVQRTLLRDDKVARSHRNLLRLDEQAVVRFVDLRVCPLHGVEGGFRTQRLRERGACSRQIKVDSSDSSELYLLGGPHRRNPLSAWQVHP
jgi:hypothetical protein